MNNIYIFIVSGFFDELGVDVILRIFNKVIETFCGKTIPDTSYYSKQSNELS